MPHMRLPRIRFTLKSLLVLVLGMAIGYSLNLQTLRLIAGRFPYPSPPPYTIAPPDVLQIDISGSDPAYKKPRSLQLPVAPDGRINLGDCGLVYVAGMTIEEAKAVIEKAVAKSVASPRIVVDVVAYNSKTYYVISQPISGTSSVTEFPFTGNETVLDAIAQLGGITLTGPPEISISRPPPNGSGPPTVFKVDWPQIASGKSDSTNYAIQPRDRIIITQ